MKNSVQDGDSLAFTNTTGSDIAAGDVVELKHCLGIAATDIPNGGTGTVYLEGVYTVPKVAAAVFVQGEKLIWIHASLSFDDSSAVAAAGDITGGAVAWEDGAAAATTATIKLTPGNATLT